VQPPLRVVWTYSFTIKITLELSIILIEHTYYIFNLLLNILHVD